MLPPGLIAMLAGVTVVCMRAHDLYTTQREQFSLRTWDKIGKSGFGGRHAPSRLHDTRGRCTESTEIRRSRPKSDVWDSNLGECGRNTRCPPACALATGWKHGCGSPTRGCPACSRTFGTVRAAWRRGGSDSDARGTSGASVRGLAGRRMEEDGQWHEQDMLAGSGGQYSGWTYIPSTGEWSCPIHARHH